jgi:hypothetical protein
MKLLAPITVGNGGGTFGAHSVLRFAKMAGWLVAKCPGLHWEILNEPDLRGATSPTLYTALVKAAYEAMKEADSTCTVIAGAIAVPQVTSFMTDCYAAGIRGSYDALSIHTYDQLPEYPPNYDPSRHLTFNVQQQQKLMAANSDTAPLWITEFGWNTLPTDLGAVTPEQQAEFTSRWLAELSSLDIPVAVQYSLIDGAQHWGLVDEHLKPKRSYYAVKRYAFR